jgi:CRISPR-associated protein Cas5t
MYMRVLRVHLTGWTASFRYPIFVTGYQPTLPVPPVSTIYGLISAAKGGYVTPEHTRVGYVMRSEAKGIDLETIYMLSGKSSSAVSNVCKREFLLNPDIYLYITNIGFKEAFKKPAYPLLLGRSSDLAMISEIKEIQLVQKSGRKRVGCTVVPFGIQGVWGALQALPTYFSDTIPREAMGVKPYYILQDFIEYDGDEFLYDEEMDWGVYING